LVVRGISHERLGHIPVAFLAGVTKEVLLALKDHVQDLNIKNRPDRLRALALYPQFSGLKPGLSDFEESFSQYNCPL
jgi:hypothetical protein